MRRLTALAALLVLGCAPTAPGVDGGRPPRDAAVPDTPPRPDAGRTLVDPRRPPGARALDLHCGELEYDIDDPVTFDSREELAVAYGNTYCALEIRCAIPAGGSCDPTNVVSRRDLVTPVDLERAEACLRALGTTACDAIGAAQETCRGIFRGTGADGHPCTADRECLSLDCAIESGSTCGVCAPNVCEPACDATELCERSVCVRLPTAGEPCRPSSSTFTPTPRCAPGLVCGPAETCETPGGIGAACTIGIPLAPFGPGNCAEGLLCNGASCVPLPGDGEPCLVFAGLGVPITMCAEGLLCWGSTCVTPIEASVGEACDYTHPCEAGADCLDAVCVARPGALEPCRVDGRCADGLVCNQIRVCAPMVGPGCACDDDLACPTRFRCVASRCQFMGVAIVGCGSADHCDGYPCVSGRCDPGLYGERCSEDLDCAEGSCRPFRIGECLPYRLEGERCDHDPRGCISSTECEDGTCVATTPDPCAGG